MLVSVTTLSTPVKLWGPVGTGIAVGFVPICSVTIGLQGLRASPRDALSARDSAGRCRWEAGG